MENKNDDKEAILKKIKKLMALAGSPNENEARIASEKAQELMVRHQLSVQTIEATDLDYDDECIDQANKMTKEHSFILSILREHFFVKTYIQRKYEGLHEKSMRAKYKIHIKMVGTPTNVAVARYVYEYLMQTYKGLWKTYKTDFQRPESAKTSYYAGLTLGIKAHLKEVQKKVETETGMVLVDDTGLVKKMKEMGLRKGKSSSYNHSATDQDAGHEHGKKVSIARALDSGNESKGYALSYKK